MRGKYKRRSLMQTHRDLQNEVFNMFRLPTPTGIFEALKELPPDATDAALIDKVVLAVSNLETGGGLHPEQVQAFLDALLQPSKVK